jgi:hypothetical protein
VVFICASCRADSRSPPSSDEKKRDRSPGVEMIAPAAPANPPSGQEEMSV